MPGEPGATCHAQRLARRERVLDVEVSADSLAPILAGLGASLRGGDGPRSLACANAHSVVMARRDPAVARALNRFDVVLPDGIGVVLASRLRGGAIPGKIGGPDLFRAVNELADAVGGCSYFFLGSTAPTLALIAARLRERYPRIALAGTHAPSFGELSDAESLAIVRRINQVRPTVLWVGMTAPKQELWVSRYGPRIDARVIGCIGAAFDYFAGTKRRPARLAACGLLWAYRLATEPRRLWRRYLVSSPLFVYWIAKETVWGRARPIEG
jgi:N-acetylglucosaminyldiphosphoundecaprenol N-acetyl-beta-D-mannosaminyltransferase